MDYQPRFTNLVTMRQRSFEQFAARPAFGVKQGSRWTWITYQEFAEQAERARALLYRLGVTRGDRVALITNNRIEWPIVTTAAHELGACVVPMYESQLDEDWRFILADCGARVCFVADDVIESRVSRFRIELPALEELVNFERRDESTGSFSFLMDEAAQDPVPAIIPEDGELAYVFYTSGTTGVPKGVELTHYNCAANTSAVIDVLPLEPEDRSLGFLPWAHVFGGATELNALQAAGASLAICGSADKIVEYLVEVRPTMLVSVPRIWNRIFAGLEQQMAEKPRIVQAIFRLGLSAQSKRRRGQPLSFAERLSLPLARKLIFTKVVERLGGRLRYAFSAAAALSPEVAEFIDNIGIRVFEAYGLTEASAGVSGNSPLLGRKLGSVGKPIPGVEVKLDTNPGTEEGEGEILVYGTGVMAGYHGRPDLTAEVMTEDGGLRTGDLGRFDEDGFLFITGRIKELFKLANGKYVSPVPLEEKIALSPYIAQVMIYGADRPHLVSLVVPDLGALTKWAQAAGNSSSPGELVKDPRVGKLLAKEIARLSSEFRGYERIRKFIIVPEEFSVENDLLTPTLKIKRHNVEEVFGAELAALYD